MQGAARLITESRFPDLLLRIIIGAFTGESEMKKIERPVSLSVCSKELMDEAVSDNKTAAAFIVDGMMESLIDVMKERPEYKAVDYVIRVEARSAASIEEDLEEARQLEELIPNRPRQWEELVEIIPKK